VLQFHANQFLEVIENQYRGAVPCSFLEPIAQKGFDCLDGLRGVSRDIDVQDVCRACYSSVFFFFGGCIHVNVFGSRCSVFATAWTMDVFPAPERPVTSREETSKE
jgi:hypothetical protein